MASSDDLIDFVRDALGRGIARADIASALNRAGWDRERSSAALAAFAEVEFAVPVPRPRPYVSARDAFLYLVLFATLYISVFNLGSLIFQFINLRYPDPASTYMSGGIARSVIRWSISSLIVAFPIFLAISRLIGRELRQDPGAKRGSTVRRWLIYLTLFVAAGVLIGDVIALIYNVLSGELTSRFILKALTIGVIAGAVFGYYLTLVRGDERDADPGSSLGRRALAGVAIVAVLAAIGGGIVLLGSPAQARREMLDARRVSDLRQINQSVNLFWTRTKHLPASIEELARERGIFVTQLDPATGQPYAYELIDAETYRLCATFSGSSDREPAGATPSFWAHGAGRQCFELAAKDVKPQ